MKNKIYQKVVSLLCCLMILVAIPATAYGATPAPTFNQIKKKSLKQFEMYNETKDKVYEVYLYSDNAKIIYATEDDYYKYPKSSVGDKLVIGDFKLAYALKGGKNYQIYQLPKLISEDCNISYVNLSNNMIRVIRNQQGVPDFLEIYMPYLASNQGSSIIFTIVDGKFRGVPFINEDKSLTFSRHYISDFEARGNGMFASKLYNQFEGMIILNYYKYNPQTKQLIWNRTDMQSL